MEVGLHMHSNAHVSLLLQPPPMKLTADRAAAAFWIYPLNKPKRDYQFNIVRNCLFDNTLVALPTGLGKTFIAGCVMLNCTSLAARIFPGTDPRSQFTVGFLLGKSSSLHPRNHSSPSKSRPATRRVVYLEVMLSS